MCKNHSDHWFFRISKKSPNLSFDWFWEQTFASKCSRAVKNDRNAMFWVSMMFYKIRALRWYKNYSHTMRGSQQNCQNYRLCAKITLIIDFFGCVHLTHFGAHTAQNSKKCNSDAWKTNLDVVVGQNKKITSRSWLEVPRTRRVCENIAFCVLWSEKTQDPSLTTRFGAPLFIYSQKKFWRNRNNPPP